MMRRRIFLTLLGLGLGASAGAQAAGPLRIVVSFMPGGPVDAVARVLAEPLGREPGRMVVVDNKPGANGALGAMEVLRAEPDGSTLWITSVGAAAINPVLHDKLPYDMAGEPLQVPHKGAAPAIADLMGGRVSGFFGDVPGPAVRRTLQTPQVRHRLLQSGTEPASSTRQELAALLLQDTQKRAGPIQARQIKAE